MTKFFLKLFISFLVIIITYTLILFLINFNSTKQHFTQTFQKDLKNLNIILTEPITNYLIKSDTASIIEYVNQVGKQLEIRLTIIGNDGVVLIDSRGDASKMDNHLSRPEVIQARDNQVGFGIRFSNTTHAEMLYVANRLEANGKTIGYIRTSYYLTHINDLFNKLIKETLTIIGILIFLVFVAIYFITYSIAKPLKQMTSAFESVASGNFGLKLQINRKDELKKLVSSFNKMSEKLGQYFAEIQRQNVELKHLFNSIPDSIFLLNLKNEVILANITFYRNFSLNPENLHIDNTNLPYELINSIKNVTNSNKFESVEFVFNNKIFTSTINFIDLNNEILVVISDITDIKKIEQIKKDFVINVSHELKTPLTAIKGFIETLEEEVTNDEHLHYIQIVRRHTDRLITIVKDLLLLTELEDEAYTNKLIISNVDLSALIENIKRLFEQKLKEKNLYFKIKIEPNVPKIQVDAFRLEQVFVNLFNNAIKFTDTGGIEINIKRIEDNIQINFFDTGAGVPKDDQDRIFERFYISEKSRSRKFGGTGIGLSIVKHIVLLHNGSICLDKNYENGAKFDIIIPISYSYK